MALSSCLAASVACDLCHAATLRFAHLSAVCLLLCLSTSCVCWRFSLFVSCVTRLSANLSACRESHGGTMNDRSGVSVFWWYWNLYNTISQLLIFCNRRWKRARSSITLTFMLFMLSELALSSISWRSHKGGRKTLWSCGWVMVILVVGCEIVG